MIAQDHDLSAGPRLARATGRSVFGQDAAGYHAARLDYPEPLYRRIFDRTGAQDLAIMEVGGGTGLATEALLRAGPGRMVVVEPDPSLAAYLRERFAPAAEVVQSGMEDVEADGSFDLIAAATSFHWLDPVLALAKARQLLRPGGHIAIWWNVYRQPGIGDRFADLVMPLLRGMELPVSETPNGHYSLDAAHHHAQFEAAGFTVADDHVFRRERTLTTEQVRALYSSHSWVRSLSREGRDHFLGTLERIATEEFGGVVPNTVLTPLYVAQSPL